ncbi:MAG: molybdopterin-dependent oxidoreductase [Candidatus Cloacimonetes bacterium]|nr:molybdopterin-dependent oxidoreductase [Candidatus Cloacimonadota bacterium]
MKSQKRKDAFAKLTGKCRFLDDYTVPDMLQGYIIYTTIDRGWIRKINFPAGFDLQEFTIVSASDIPGKNIVPEPVNDQPFMTSEVVDNFGQVILGIAHPNREILKKFISLTRIEYERRNAVTDTKECLDNEANQFGEIMHLKHELAPTYNLRHLWKWQQIFYTQHQEQAYLEPQGMLAEYNIEKEEMKITGTMQCPFFVKDAVESIMGKAVKNVVIETSEGIGGAFGGKEDFPNLLAGVTALLAWKAQKPVKIVLDRKDDLLITTNRHPSRVDIIAIMHDQNGFISKIDIDYRLDAGAFQTLSPVVLHRGILHATGGYNIAEVKIKGSLHRSNTPPNGAFRGFGAPQAIFAMESFIDNVAHRLSISPLRLRQLNLLKTGDQLPTSQIVTENHLQDCLDRVVQLSGYKKKFTDFQEYNKTNTVKKGIGLALGLHGGGYTGNGEKVLQSRVKIVLEKNGMVNIYVANVEMGQGAHTTLAQMVNSIFKLPPEKVNVVIPNTSQTPNSGPTVASRTIYVVGNLLQKLAERIKSELGFADLKDHIAKNQNSFPQSFEEVFVPDPADDFDDITNQGVAYHDFSWAACVVEITYDPDLYQIRVDKCWNVLDVGKVINEGIALGQVYGGVVQALGWALTENIYKKGYPRLSGFTDYTLPASLDIPEIKVEFIHTNSPVAKGLGEIPMDYPAPAVRNAFLQATGIMINELPLTPERIFAAQGRSKK